MRGGDGMIKNVEARLEEVEQWARSGLTQQQIAHNLGIGLTTLKDYMKKSPSISAAIRGGKEVADVQVENALYKAALNGNVSAMIFWLKNRRPDKWKDKREPEEIEIMRRELKLKEKKLELELKKVEELLNDEKIINITVGDTVLTPIKVLR